MTGEMYRTKLPISLSLSEIRLPFQAIERNRAVSCSSVRFAAWKASEADEDARYLIPAARAAGGAAAQAERVARDGVLHARAARGHRALRARGALDARLPAARVPRLGC